MLLFENSLIKLDYNPSTGILEVSYPDLHDYLLPKIEHSINILINNVKHYDVKRVLLNCSKTAISVGSDESRQVAVYLYTRAEGCPDTITKPGSRPISRE